MGGDLADVRLWASELDALHERFMHRFNRSEPRESALAYMRGLVAPLQRKNGWTLAEEAGHAGPDCIHRLLNRIDWNADEVLSFAAGDSVSTTTPVGQGPTGRGFHRVRASRCGHRPIWIRSVSGRVMTAQGRA
jgi:hypothetical protein